MSALAGSVFALTAAPSFVIERIALPRGPLRRSWLSSWLHILAVYGIANLMLAVTSRPVFSAGATLALVGLLVAVSNAKYASLREPFVFTDLSLFSQLWSHPRLYLPFLGIGTVVAIGAGGVLVVAGFIAERPAPPYPATVALPFAVLLSVLALRLAAALPLTLDACADQRRHGFVAVFIAYLLNGLRPATFRRLREALAAGPYASGAPRRRPDVIVIQSESFFDVRRLGQAIAPDLLARFDAAQREACWHGRLSVPAWGANTMRTEFAVLTGTSPASLGYARFYPYAFVRRHAASLAAWFGRGGYRTVAIHPYYADFFGRDRVFPLLGFSRLLDIGHFAGAARAGPYVADAAVADAIIATLEAPGDAPRFVFAMTMENHGPLHLETVLPGESARRHTLGDGAPWRDLTAYLRHIENADAMLGRLLDHLRSSRREAVICFYGDHVPALSQVFDRLGSNPEHSDFFIWRNFEAMRPERRDVRAEDLGGLLLLATQQEASRMGGSQASEKTT